MENRQRRPRDPAILFIGIPPREIKTCLTKKGGGGKLMTNVLSSITYNSEDVHKLMKEKETVSI